jgi:hypothetical protein
MPEWTPGPWEASPGCDQHGDYYILPESGPPIARVCYYGGTMKARHNAQLMAHAPELYEVLEMAMRLLHEVWGRENPNHPIWRDGPRALARARGESISEAQQRAHDAVFGSPRPWRGKEGQ